MDDEWMPEWSADRPTFIVREELTLERFRELMRQAREVYGLDDDAQPPS